MTYRESVNRWRRLNRQRARFYRKYVKVWNEYYLEQGEKIADNIRDKRPEPVAGTFKVSELRAVFTAMYVDIGGKFADGTFKEIETTQKNDGTLNGTTWETLMARYAVIEGGQSIVSISATGKEQAIAMINRITALGIEQGLSIDEMTELLEQEVPSQWRIKSRWNAERIARTETIAASNHGALIGAQSTSVPLKKIWLTATDGRERQAHNDAHLQERLVNQDFTVGGQQLSAPGDKGASPENVINCRCAVAYQNVQTNPLNKS